MFVTDELRSKVASSLAALEERAKWLNALNTRDDAWHEDNTYLYAAERALHIAIECSTDAANDVIDALVMREPGSYPDIIRVLMEEDVVTKDWFRQYEPALAFRDKLVHGYNRLTRQEVRDAVASFGPLLHPYASMLKRYLDLPES